MIDLYYWPTPNGHKITLMLEETGMPYRIKPVNIGRGDQFKPDFQQISPNNRMPAIVDSQPLGGGEALSLFESGAILQYLAEKTGRFMPCAHRARYHVLEWLYWQVGGLGPMLGQNHFFSHYAPQKIPYVIDRYVNETRRLCSVLERQLSGCDFITGNDYSIADMAAYPWIVSQEGQGVALEDFPRLKRWFDTIAGREATRRAYAVADSIKGRVDFATDEEARRHMFRNRTAKS